jgi:hypothetical protein
MKSIIKLLFLPIIFLTACVDSLDDFNVDQKRAPVVPAETLYSAALKSLADILATPNVNNNNYRLYIQHWSTTQYLDEPRYVLNVRLIPQNFWDALYRDVLSDLKEARRILNEDQLINPTVKNNQLAQIGIIEAYSWLILVNTFGNVPYSEALDTSIPLPQYDDAQTIYLDVLNKLNESIALLDPSAAGFGTGELIYASKAAAQRIPSWIKLGNSIKMKMAIVLIDNPATSSIATTAVQEAAAAGVFTANADNARFPYLPDPPSNNPVSANLNLSLQSRRDYVGAKPFIDYLNQVQDPRRGQFFNTVPGTSNFVGGYYGYTNNPVANFSEISDKVKAPGLEALFVDYSEIEFLKAEAVERGIIPGTAADHYNNAITASITYWGGTPADAATYLANPEVSYATATGDWKQKIGTQKWIALYNRGWDAWVEWRRLDYPVLLTPDKATPPAGQDVPAVALSIPVRMIYPINEQTLNGTNRTAASGAIGEDVATTKLFWDVN